MQITNPTGQFKVHTISNTPFYLNEDLKLFDEGIWRRICVIPFMTKFKTNIDEFDELNEFDELDELDELIDGFNLIRLN